MRRTSGEGSGTSGMGCGTSGMVLVFVLFYLFVEMQFSVAVL